MARRKRYANPKVGAAPHRCKWTRNRAGDTYETTCRGVKIYVVRRYPKQWVIRFDGHWLPHVFEGPRAAQRYAAGAVMEGVEDRSGNPLPVAGIAAAAVAGTAAGFVLGKSGRKQRNPSKSVQTLKNKLLR